MKIKKWRDWSPEARWWVVIISVFLTMFLFDEYLLLVEHDIIAFELFFGIIVGSAFGIRALLRIPAPTLSTPFLPLIWQVMVVPVLWGVLAIIVADWWVR